MKQYASWRTDKPAEDGFTPELVSLDLNHFNGTNADELNTYPFEGVDTMIKAFRRNLKRLPQHPLFGTRIDKKYEWITLSEADVLMKQIAAGFVKLNLVPEVEAEERTWKFMGI